MGEEMGVSDDQPKAEAQRPMSKQILLQIEHCQQQQEKHQVETSQTQCIPVDEHNGDVPVVEEKVAYSGVDSNSSTPCSVENSIAISKLKAFRAAAQGDTVTLHEIINSVSFDIWSKWENRAGKTLLAMSQERGSTAVHLLVAKALGIVKELKCETFEEREAVWVYSRGDIQPKRATVLATNMKDTEMILMCLVATVSPSNSKLTNTVLPSHLEGQAWL